MTSEAVSLIIAFWGAITGTIALTLSVLQYFVERPRLTLRWLRHFVVVHQLADGKMKETDQNLARLIVTNTGRQSIRVVGAHFATRDKTGAVKLFLFAHGVLQTEGRVLSPESPTTEFHADECALLDDVVFLSVTDGFGKSHNLWRVPWYRRFSINRQMKGKGRKKLEKSGG